MFICGFIGVLKLTNCNYSNFLFSFIGISFAFSKSLDTFVLIKKQKRRPENARGLSDISRETYW
jgi:hypothetical protein